MSGADTRSLLGPTRLSRTVLAYAAMLAGAAGLFFVIRHLGTALEAPAAPAVSRPPAHAPAGHLLTHVLVMLAAVTLAARTLGLVFERWLKQPAVMGEIVAGLMLGPSVLGALSPAAFAALVPSDALPTMGIVANIGVVLFMFLVGLEVDTRLLRGNTHAVLAISHASIVIPFLSGSALALWLFPRYATHETPFTVFALFLGVSLSVTAFPVLARILTDRRMQRTPLGITALSCAAVDDVTAWCLLAIVSGVATAHAGAAGRTLGLAAGYVVFMLAAVRPLARRLARREAARTGPLSVGVLAVVFGAVLLSALATEAIGIHALFGAFLMGTVLPHEGRLAEQLRARLEDVVVVLLLPVFFAFTGVRTQVGLVSTARDWGFCALIVLVATAGKFGGTWIAARLAGLGARESSALGILMNTRGLMELIVLNVGLDMGVLSPTLFTMLVLMAIATTFSTTPVLDWLMRRAGPAGAATA